jgi:Cu2+-exporting ATPase
MALAASAGTPDRAWMDRPAAQRAYTAYATDREGATLATSHFQVGGMVCAACADLIEAAVLAQPGVAGAEVNYASQRLKVAWRPGLALPSQVVAAVEAIGYAATPDTTESARALRRREERGALWRMVVAVFCAMQVMMYATPAYVAEPGSLAPDTLRLLQWASWLLTLPVLGFSALPLFRQALGALRRGEVGMDAPVVLGLAVGFVASTGATFDPGGVFGHAVYFDSLTMFVAALLVGRWLTLRAQHRVTAALEAAVARIAPAARRMADDGSITAVDPAELVPGDRVRVLAGEAFPADGELLDGPVEVDEALLTGESRPVARQAGDAVLAGSLALNAAATLRVQRTGADTRHGAVVALMRQALVQRPTLLRAADRIARPFLWGVLALAALAGAGWSLVDPTRAVAVAVSVLIVTCPCALALAAPSALLAAAGSLARRGILVQRLDAIEALARLDLIFLDKTGTLTEDRLQWQGLVPLPAAQDVGLDAPALQALAVALARHSTHPLSRAIAQAAVVGPVPELHGVRETAGRGLSARLPDGRELRLGARDFAAPGTPAGADAVDAPVWLGLDGQAVALCALGETLKPDAAAAVQALRDDGLRVALLSGDTPARVRAVATALALDEAEGGASPEAKLARIERAQAQGLRVGMAGDGLNDAPVVARADASFAFAQGSAITQTGADVVLLSGKVDGLVATRRTARRAMRVLKQNLAWSVAYNALSVPLAVAGLFPPWAAGIGMALSSLLVVANALRV